MPLALREVLLVFRAKDLASRTIGGLAGNVGQLGEKGGVTSKQMMGLGSAIAGVGIGIATIGAAGVYMFNKAADAAMSYNQTVATTFSQVDKGKASFQQLSDIGLSIAQQFPVAFDSVQKSLYDIFSSMDVNAAQAKRLLGSFALAATAGQVDIQTAGKATIAILNAFHLPLSSLSTVLDLQFQLVRKGVGTYADFASTIGRAIPPTVAAGQTVQTMAAMMAFLTRNGLSAAMSATSVARSMDLIGNPKFQANMKAAGLSVVDANGNFKPMVDILQSMYDKFHNLTQPQLSQVFANLFKGAGNNVQARRFFDVIFKDFGQFKSLLGNMNNAGGAAFSAFAKEFTQPASQAQLLTNRLKVLQIRIGQDVIPIKLKLISVVNKLLAAWDRLSKPVQDTIIHLAMFATAAALVIGVALTIVGLLVILVGAFMALGLGVGAAVATLAGLIAVLALIPVAIFLIIKHWKTLGPIVKETWATVKADAEAAYIFLRAKWDQLWPHLVNAWFDIRKAAIEAFQYILPRAQAAWNNIRQWSVTAAKWIVSTWHTVWPMLVEGWNDIKNGAIAAFNYIGPRAASLAREIMTWWNQIYPDIARLWNNIVQVISRAVANAIILGKAFSKLFMQEFRTIQNIVHNMKLGETFKSIWKDISKTFNDVWPGVKEAAQHIANALLTIWAVGLKVASFISTVLVTTISIAVAIISRLWDTFGKNIVHQATYAWEFVVSSVKAAMLMLRGVINIITGLINGDWHRVWKGILQVISATWDGIFALFRFALKTLGNLASVIVKAIFFPFKWLYDELVGHSLIPDLINGIVHWFGRLPGMLAGVLTGAVKWLYGVGEDIVTGLWHGIVRIWHDVVHWFSSIGGLISGVISSPLTILEGIGKSIFQGLWNGMQSVWHKVTGWLHTVTHALPFHKGPPSVDAMLLVNNGMKVMEGFQKGLADGWQKVQNQLGGYTGNVSASFSNGAGGISTGGRGSITIAPGAITIAVEGSIDSGVMPQIEAALRRTIDDLTGLLD